VANCTSCCRTAARTRRSSAVRRPTSRCPSTGSGRRDGKTIYFKAADAERRASIWGVPAEGGIPRLLVRFDDPQKPSLRREFATDGVRFFFTIAQDESDIWVAEVK